MKVKDCVSIGIIGLGCRAQSLIKKVFLPMLKGENPDIRIAAVCDKYQERIDDTCRLLFDEVGITPFSTTDSDEVIP